MTQFRGHRSCKGGGWSQASFPHLHPIHLLVVAGQEPDGRDPWEAWPREPAGLPGDASVVVLEPRPDRAVAPGEVSRWTACMCCLVLVVVF